MNSAVEDKLLGTEATLDASDANNDGEFSGEDERPKEESSEFALKMINSVKAMNSGELSHYEMVNSFSIADELKCLFMFIQALPHRPIVPMYPETPFLFFKGVLLPRSFDLTEEMANDVETFMKGNNSEYFTDLHLHDLESVSYTHLTLPTIYACRSRWSPYH